MNFGEKVRKLRKENKYTQKDLADILGVSTRTVVSYENGQSYPKQREIYERLAQTFQVDINYFYMENEDQSSYGEEDVQAQAKKLIDQASAMFAGGSLSEEDKDAVMRALQDAYWDGRKDQEN